MSASFPPHASRPSRLPAWWRQVTRPGSLIRWVVLGTVLALLVAWGTVGGVLVSERRDALAAEREHLANLARILQEQTVRVIATTDQAARRLAEAVADGRFDEADFARYANETGLAPHILTQLSLVGPDGRFRGSNLDPEGSQSGHVDLSSREHVKVHLAPDKATGAPPVAPGGLFIGKPVLGKVSGKWTIQLSRRIDGPDGRVLGVVVASLDPRYFEDLYRSVVLGDQGGVTLIGSDLTVRARVIGGRSVGVGTTLTVGAGGSLLTAAEGSHAATSRVDGVQRLLTYRQVGDLPLYVVVSRASGEALAAWRSTRNMALALTATLSVALLAAAVIFAVGVRRLEARNAALRASEARAQAANQAKTDFLAAISHELRTPLTSIRGFAELMELRIKEEKFREQAGLIRQASEHLNDLLTDILDLVKVEAGAMEVARMPVALHPLVEGTARFFAVTAAEKQLQLLTRMPEDGREVWVLGDELRLKQILNNLLSNAFKFTEHGSVSIEVARVDRRVRLSVVDTGPGIPAELHEVIFERFRQGGRRVTHRHGGTGLGLALSRAMAERMGGTLTVQSAVGQGARFTLSLPAA